VKKHRYHKRTDIDIILLDNKLPGISGIQCWSILTRSQKEPLVMMITSYAHSTSQLKQPRTERIISSPNHSLLPSLKQQWDTSPNISTEKDDNTDDDEEKQTRFQFLSVLSHRLKSPVNAVEGYLRMMQEKQVGRRYTDYSYDRTLSCTFKSMRSLITDL